MPRSIFSDTEKVKVVVRGLQSEVIVTRFCAEQGISRSTFYRWRSLVLKGLSTFMSVSQKGS